MSTTNPGRSVWSGMNNFSYCHLQDRITNHHWDRSRESKQTGRLISVSTRRSSSVAHNGEDNPSPRYEFALISDHIADFVQDFDAYSNRAPSDGERGCHVIHSTTHPNYFSAFYHKGNSNFLWGAFGDKKDPQQSSKLELSVCTGVHKDWMPMCSNLTDTVSIEQLCKDVNRLREKITFLHDEHQTDSRSCQRASPKSDTSMPSTERSSPTDRSSNTSASPTPTARSSPTYMPSEGTTHIGSSPRIAESAGEDNASLPETMKAMSQKVEFEGLRNILLEREIQDLGSGSSKKAGYDRSHRPKWPMRRSWNKDEGRRDYSSLTL